MIKYSLDQDGGLFEVRENHYGGRKMKRILLLLSLIVFLAVSGEGVAATYDPADYFPPF